MKRKALEHLRKVDPVFEKLIAKFGRVAIEPRGLPPFQSLVHAIAHQQLTGKVAEAILGRFEALFTHDRFPAPEEVLKLEMEVLRSAGFSRAKAASVVMLAERSQAGLVPSMEQCEIMTDAEIIASLTEIKGIGRWTAEMFLIFNLGRPDILPVHDFGVCKGFQLAYRKRKLPKPAALEKFGKRWSPYRTTATLYLYRAADSLKADDW